MMSLEQKFQILINKLNAGNFDEVIFEAIQLNKKHPEQEVFYNLLSLAYQGKGDYQSSIKLLENALRRSKNNINFLNNLGLSYYKKNDFLSAEKYFLNVLKLNPRYINTMNNLGSLYQNINRFDEAEKILRKSLEINSEVIQTNYNLASLLQSIGKFDEAKKIFLKLMKLDENFTKADLSYAILENYQKNSEHLNIMEKKLKNENLNKSNIKDLSFALGKAYEDLNDYEKSFFYIKKGNDIKKNLTKYKIEKEEILFDKIKKFHLENQTYKLLENENEKKIIFILGMPRTGSSLVEQIISNHNEVFGGGEISFLSDHFKILFDEYQKNITNKIYIENVKKNYLIFLSRMNDSKIFTDKAPLNFRWIGLINNMFPNSKIINCTRNSLENCWSIYKNEFEGGMLFSNNFKDIASYYKLYLDLMKFWKSNTKKEILDLNYEDLINDPEKQIKNIINFCDLKWDENCLKFYENKKSIKTVSFMQARKPIYKKSIKGTLNYDKYLSELKNLLEN